MLIVQGHNERGHKPRSLYQLMRRPIILPVLKVAVIIYIIMWLKKLKQNYYYEFKNLSK